MRPPESAPAAKVPDYDPLARWYGAMETLLAGGLLQQARTAWVSGLSPPQRVLMVGEGRGRLLAVLAARFPNAEFHVVDASPAMLRAAETACPRMPHGGPGNPTFHCLCLPADPLPEGSFDLVTTPFFLDGFQGAQLAAVVKQLGAKLSPGGRWWVADFAIPGPGWRGWRSRVILGLLYRFFGWTTGLPVRTLEDPEPCLRRAGLVARGRRSFSAGLVFSTEWVRE